MELPPEVAVLTVFVVVSWVTAVVGLSRYWQCWVLIDRFRGRDSRAAWLKR